MTTTALVTGGAGFIGSHLCEALLDHGDRVRVLDNFSTGCDDNLKDSIKDIELVRGDIRDSEIVSKSLKDVNVVFHLAAQVSVAESMDDPANCFDINITGTNLILQNAARHGVERVVMSSSAAVYGDQELLPIKEENPLFPQSPYAASKRMDEILAELYSRSFNLPVTCLRYFNVFGPRQNPNSAYAAAIPIFIRQMLSKKPPILFGDGGQTRDFIYVKDVARANILAADQNQKDCVIMNICTGKQISIRDLLLEIRKLIPSSPDFVTQPARSGDIYHSYGSSNLAKEVINFEPTIDFSEGLGYTIEWMKK
jgi:UDP-glucose 4-epimerase